jgi:hypothetical protein
MLKMVKGFVFYTWSIIYWVWTLLTGATLMINKIPIINLLSSIVLVAILKPGLRLLYLPLPHMMQRAYPGGYNWYVHTIENFAVDHGTFKQEVYHSTADGRDYKVVIYKEVDQPPPKKN